MKDERIKTLFQLPPKKIHTVLEELKNLRCRFDKGEEVVIPVITLHLRTGHNITGVLIGIGEDRHEECILFHLYDSVRMSPTYDVVYLSPVIIEALTLHNVADIAHQFSFGKISKPAPSKLDLKRKMKVLAEKLSEKCGKDITLMIDWMTIPKDDDALREIDELVGNFTVAIMGITDDNLSKETISESVKQIIFQNSERSFASLINDTLTISTDLRGESDKQISCQELRDMIEDAF